MGCNEEQPARVLCRLRTRGEMQRRMAAAGPIFVIAASRTKPPGRWRRKPEPWRPALKQPAPTAENLSRQTEHAHDGRLVSLRVERPAASAVRLTAQARRNRPASYPGTGHSQR